MKRPFDEGDVAQRLSEPHRVGVALWTTALVRQQHNRKIGPRRLVTEPTHQAAQIGGLDGLVGDHREPSAALDLLKQLGNIAADSGAKTRLLDQRRGHRRVASRRSEDDGALG
jgi:hypothetical protein